MPRSSRRRTILLASLLSGLVTLGAAQPSRAQSLGDRLRKKAEEARKNAEESLRRPPEPPPRPTSPSPAADTPEPTATTTGPGEGMWVNYDFTPGNRPLFVDDFSGDAVGDFPRRLELRSGTMELAELGGRRFLRATSQFELRIPLKETLPERFTLEFDMRSSYHASSQSTVKVDFGSTSAGDHVVCGPFEAGIYGQGGQEQKAVRDLHSLRLRETLIHCRVMVDGSYAKVYVNETRVANHPNTKLGRGRAITLSGFVVDPNEILIGDIRVAAGGKKLYDALTASGRVATQGILFDSGSDRIRPESTPTLKEIGEMLAGHPDLRLAIEGHTDNAGDAGENLALSGKRAEAVRAYLVTRHGIDAGRLGARGLGASKPLAPNTTAEGRQQNRRVELVRM